MSKVRKSIALSFGQNYIGFVLQFLSSVIIARLLTPHEIGIFSVAIVLIGFSHTLRDFGSTSYVIREKELTQDKIRAAFALTLITAWLLAIAIGLGSGYAAEFYREPGIRSVMLVLSLNFILLPFGSIPMAYMHRQMDFQHIALINIIPYIVSTVASIGLAYAGFSYLAMAWGSVSGAICTILLVQLWRPKDLPFLPGFKEIRKVFSFGTLASLITMFYDLGQSEAELIIGRLSGVTMVGYFSRAMGLISTFDTLIMKALWSVALPHFSLQSRSEVGMKDSFLSSSTLVTAVAWPFFMNLGFLANPIILILYGKQWGFSVSPLQLLCISSILTAPFLFISSMMTATGQMKRYLCQLFVRVMARGGLVFVAAPYGLKIIAATFIVSGLIDMVISYLQCKTILGINLKEMLSALRPSVAVVLMSSALPLIIFLFGDGILAGHLWMQLFIGAATAVLGWIAGLFLFRHPLHIEIGNIFRMVQRMLATLKIKLKIFWQ